MAPRRPAARRNRRRGPPRRRQYGSKFGRIRRNLMSYSKTFTEVLSAGNIQMNTGGQFVCRFNDIPQAGQYAALYKQFCIKKLQVMLLPRLNSFDANTTASVGTSYWVPRLAFSVNDTPGTTIPLSEVDVLQDNGARVVSLVNKKTLVCYPKPSIGSIDLGLGAVAATRQRKQVWLNTGNSDTTNNGQNVQHHGITYWLTGNPLYNEFMFDVYYKITFQMRDPA